MSSSSPRPRRSRPRSCASCVNPWPAEPTTVRGAARWRPTCPAGGARAGPSTRARRPGPRHGPTHPRAPSRGRRGCSPGPSGPDPASTGPAARPQSPAPQGPAPAPTSAPSTAPPSTPTPRRFRAPDRTASLGGRAAARRRERAEPRSPTVRRRAAAHVPPGGCTAPRRRPPGPARAPAGRRGPAHHRTRSRPRSGRTGRPPARPAHTARPHPLRRRLRRPRRARPRPGPARPGTAVPGQVASQPRHGGNTRSGSGARAAAPRSGRSAPTVAGNVPVARTRA